MSWILTKRLTEEQIGQLETYLRQYSEATDPFEKFCAEYLAMEYIRNNKTSYVVLHLYEYYHERRSSIDKDGLERLVIEEY